MHADDFAPDPATPDSTPAKLDPDAMKDAHGRTGRLLKNAGLPFEEDEFDDDGDSSSSSEDLSSSSSSEE